MKLLNSYANMPEAYLDKGMLESHGIPAVVQANALSQIFPAPGAGMGSIDLFVPEDKFEEAQKLIEAGH